MYSCGCVSLVQELSREHPYLKKVITQLFIMLIVVHEVKWLRIYQSLSEFHLNESLPGMHCTLYRGVSFYLLQLWVCQESLGNCDHQLSSFSSLLFRNVLSSIISLRFNLSSFFYSTNILEHLPKCKAFLLAYILLVCIQIFQSLAFYMLFGSLYKYYFSPNS